MSAFTVRIGATRLSCREVLVQPTSLGWLDATQSVSLAAGTSSIRVRSGVFTDFSFTVTAHVWRRVSEIISPVSAVGGGTVHLMLRRVK